MLCVETIGKIRRRRLVQGESISAIARDLGLSRNTVKRALRSEGERFEYRRSSQPRPKLGPFLETLEAWLEAEKKFKCPCHGSGFKMSGVNFEGPAPRPLERYAVRRTEEGEIIVDKSRKFQRELGQWDDPDSYILL